jgi:hypothetical protein
MNDNLRKATINTGKVFTEMAEEVTRKQNEADREELDTMWQQALIESVKDGEQFTRYHFAALVAAAEREACAKVCDELAYFDAGDSAEAMRHCAQYIRASGTK